MKSTILIIEDDKDINEMLTALLTNNGFNVENAYSGTEGLLVHSDNVDLILLDLMLPGKNGEEIIKELKEKNNVPIIVMSAIEDVNKKIDLFSLGANDYITKPFNIQILLAKIGSLLRRTNMQEVNDKIDVKDFILNTSNNTIEKDGKVIELTKNEYKILKYLVQNRGKIVSREDIMECLWESESFIDDNTLTVNITRLRNKLEELELKELLETKRGQGYILKKGVN